ncbi:IclR family transcriptional regulator [Halobellus clavatus]|uniref:Transcriptional regulator, IclR family n=1 Tax=Halobellus clavatus TaxID=660517 RepID=A0A1H3GZQ8_9EURY|nr:IclR family transcriptional regulator [Halobellus clavatus]SDY08772.1 transcriptional regulator, IclR family [Halobellus clavatus]
MGRDATAGRGIKSDEKLFDIVELLRDRNGAGVTEIADSLGVAKSTAHGHLTTLRDRGFVVKRDNRYHLGLKFFEYGQYVRGELDIFQSGMVVVDRLERETDEMVWLITYQNGKAMYVYGRAGDNDINVNALLGTRAYMHCNSGGKAILANLSDGRVDEIIDQHGLPGKTDNTITDRDHLDEELARIREQGYALNLSEDIEGIQAIGVPLTVDDQIQGALSVAGPAHRMSKERCEGEILDRLRAATDEIDLTLAYQ